MRIDFDNSYARLPERFFVRQAPEAPRAPALIRLNRGLAERLGLDAAWLSGPEGVAMLAGGAMPEGAEPLAMAYAGHQFGGFSPQLGDGRALLLGEVTGRDGTRYDIQLKGSGRTPFSRMGDGKAALGPVLREYIVAEAMAALGIPTTRALAAVTTGERVLREMPLPGAVLARVARSHVRVGTFQYFAVRGDAEAIRTLTEYVLARHYPRAEGESPALALLGEVIAAQARLIARWMGVGFIHGVMNTDNMSIAGETIDYGPCAFMDAYHPATVYSSIDQHGRYAYANQPGIAQWNLVRLAECLLELIDADKEAAVAKAQAAIDRFPGLYQAAREEVFRAKLGLPGAREGDRALAEDLLEAMAAGGADFTLTFRELSTLPDDPAGDATVRALFSEPEAFDAWAARWRERVVGARPEAERQAAMTAANPAIIPRNHLVEHAISAATGGDHAPFHALTEALERPFEDRPRGNRLTLPPTPAEEVRQTFCGT